MPDIFDSDVPAAMDAPLDLDEPIEATPGPEPAPEPTPEQGPEPTPEPVDMSWLDEPVEQPPQPMPQPPPGYWPQPPQQYGPPPGWMPPQQQGPTEAEFQEFLARGPNAYFDQMITQRLGQAVGPVAHEAATARRQAESFIQAQASQGIHSMQENVKRNAKEVLGKEEAFMANREIREQVRETVSGMMREAAWKARNGDPQMLNYFSDPNYYKMVLESAKVLKGYTGSQSPLKVQGGVVEGTRPQAQSEEVSLPPDLEAIAQRRGPAYREKLVKAMRDSESSNDFYFAD